MLDLTSYRELVAQKRTRFVPAWLVSSTERVPVPADAYKTDEADKRGCVIYALIDPETDQIRYIGKTRRSLRVRLTAHGQDAGNCHRVHWLTALKRKGLKPSVIVLEHLHGNWPWQEAERWWIARGRALGWPLTNDTDGGDGTVGLSPETRARMAKTWTGRKHSPATITKLREWRKTYRASAETREKMSRSMLGREIAWAGKISAAVRKLSAEQVENIRARLAAGELVKDLAAEFGVHRTTISKVKMGQYPACEATQ